MKRYPILLLLLTFILLSCSKKKITFEVTYDISPEQIQLEGGFLTIRNFPLYFQANVEQNFSKKSQISVIELVEIQCDKPININNIQFEEGSVWSTLDATHNFHTKDSLEHFQIIKSKTDFIPIFKTDQLNMRILYKGKELPKIVRLKFRMTGNYDKTNVQYRILA